MQGTDAGPILALLACVVLAVILVAYRLLMGRRTSVDVARYRNAIDQLLQQRQRTAASPQPAVTRQPSLADAR